MTISTFLIPKDPSNAIKSTHKNLRHKSLKTILERTERRYAEIKIYNPQRIPEILFKLMYSWVKPQNIRKEHTNAVGDRLTNLEK